MKRNIIIAAVMLAVFSACSGSVSNFASEAEVKVAEHAARVKARLRHEQKTDPVRVKAVRVYFSDHVAASVLVGHIEPAKSSVVSTQYPGRLVSLKVRKGQNVAAGSVLAVIESQSINSSYEAASAVYEQAKDALSRLKKVYSSGSVSEIKLVEARTAVAKAKAAYLSAQKAKDDCTIRAPYNGVVGEIYPHEGMELAALAPVMQLLDVSIVEVHASVPENEYSSYPSGLDVRIEVPATSQTYNGVLAVKGIDASKITRSYDCTFKFTDLSETSGIMPGMLCKVHLTGACENAIVIPSSAVMIDGEGRYVWCCNGGNVSKKHITSGGFSGNGVIVTSGLLPGDMLVVEGSRKISAGMKGILVDVIN